MPILTGIVICALTGIVETKVAIKTWKADKQEFAIFMAAFLGVLLLGTIYGVIIGVAIVIFALKRMELEEKRVCLICNVQKTRMHNNGV